MQNELLTELGQSLGKGKELHLVEILGKQLIIATTPYTVNLITELGPDTETSRPLPELAEEESAGYMQYPTSIHAYIEDRQKQDPGYAEKAVFEDFHSPIRPFRKPRRFAEQPFSALKGARATPNSEGCKNRRFSPASRRGKNRSRNSFWVRTIP